MSTEIAMMAARRSSKEKKKNKPRGIFTQSWAERSNMDNPMNLKEVPRVEFWADTKWEPYKEGIQQYIRRHLTTDGKDLAEWIEFRIDLDESDAEWICTAHFFPKDTSARRRRVSLDKEYDG